jgi:hypothetical protein
VSLTLCWLHPEISGQGWEALTTLLLLTAHLNGMVSRDLDLCVPDDSTKDLLGPLTVPLLRISIIQLQLVLTHFEQVSACDQ